jgi:D-sedoheptulose 7-phosphate isomerase
MAQMAEGLNPIMHIELAREQAIHSLRQGAELHLQVVQACIDTITKAADMMHKCLVRGNKILLFGNGGSAADAQHMAAEFVCRFAGDRIPLPAIALTTDTSTLTAIGNDYGFDQVFARPVNALGHSGDVAVAISTSGRSRNVLLGAEAAREKGLKLIGLTGALGGPLDAVVDLCITVPSTNTARIQECHLAIEHVLCEMVESLLFSE